MKGSPPCPLLRAAPSAGFGVAHVAAHHSSVTLASALGFGFGFGLELGLGLRVRARVWVRVG